MKSKVNGFPVFLPVAVSVCLGATLRAGDKPGWIEAGLKPSLPGGLSEGSSEDHSGISGKDGSASLPAASGPRLRVRAGVMARTMNGVSFRGAANSPGFALPQLTPADSLLAPYGPDNGPADRFYDNGFVRLDAETLAPGLFNGTTSNWGYSEDAQIQAGRLAFTGTGSYTQYEASSSSERIGLSSGNETVISPVVEFDAMFPVQKNLNVGFQASVSFTSMGQSAGGNTFRARQSLKRFNTGVTDYYDLQGMVPPVSPYAGTYSNNYPEPLLDAQPVSRELTVTSAGEDVALVENQVRQSFDADIFSLSLGVGAEWQRGRYYLRAGLGATVSIVGSEASYYESLGATLNGTQGTMLNEWRARVSDTEVVGGVYLLGGFGMRLNDRWSVEAFGRFDETMSLNGMVGPSRYSADLGGWSIGGTVGYNF